MFDECKEFRARISKGIVPLTENVTKEDIKEILEGKKFYPNIYWQEGGSLIRGTGTEPKKGFHGDSRE